MKKGSMVVLVAGLGVALSAYAACPDQKSTNIDDTCTGDGTACTKTVWDEDVSCVSGSTGNSCDDHYATARIIKGTKYNGTCGLGNGQWGLNGSCKNNLDGGSATTVNSKGKTTNTCGGG